MRNHGSPLECADDQQRTRPNADMTERDNSNVTVSGTATDVAYMDAASDNNNTTY